MLGFQLRGPGAKVHIPNCNYCQIPRMRCVRKLNVEEERRNTYAYTPKKQTYNTGVKERRKEKESHFGVGNNPH